MPSKLVICAELVDPRGRLGEQCIIIQGERIEGLREEPPGAEKVIDLRGKDYMVLPGFVDIHVHLRGLGQGYKEDEYTGSRAAAAGGIVLVADMPNTVPRLDSAEALAAKLQALRERSLVDYMVYAAVPPSPDEIEKLASVPGVAGFKIYPRDLEERARSVDKILSSSHLVVVHPELPEAEKPVAENEDSRRTLRGCYWETAAVDYLAELSPSARIHITHATCPGTVRAARRKGFTVDTTPTYLFLEPGNDCLHRVNPPIRGLTEKQKMLQLLLGGEISLVASDHAPHSPREKTGDPLLCPPGVPWLEHWPSVLYCLVSRGALSIENYLELVSLRPAKLLGVTSLGLLEPGYRASIVVARETHSRATFNYYSKATLTPYMIYSLQKCLTVTMTIVRGKIVYKEHSVEETPYSKPLSLKI